MFNKHTRPEHSARPLSTMPLAGMRPSADLTHMLRSAFERTQQRGSNDSQARPTPRQSSPPTRAPMPNAAAKHAQAKKTFDASEHNHRKQQVNRLLRK